ncbi:hypothetical protein R1flu_027310 [Riccia fluitans]|uniref:Uncharacterized protein n=1 Tax=Riccia fluitans TaxID=41844 RepID=A0ABD1XIF1_9MARC
MDCRDRSEVYDLPKPSLKGFQIQKSHDMDSLVKMGLVEGKKGCTSGYHWDELLGEGELTTAPDVVTQVEDQKFLRLKAKATVSEEYSKKEDEAVEEEMTTEDMGMEVLVGELEGLMEAKKKADMVVEQPGIQNKKKVQEWLVQEVIKALGEKMGMVALVRELENMLKVKGIPMPAPLAMLLFTEVRRGIEEKITKLKVLLGLPATELASSIEGTLVLGDLADVTEPEPITRLVSKIEKVLSG